MRRPVLWMVAFLVAILAGGGTVAALNATVFGPGDFVRIYLDALARGDAAGALSLPGVDAGGVDDRLLTDAVLTGVSDVRQERDTPLGNDRHRITMSWSTPVGAGRTDFEVERVGTRLGLFPEWGFAVSPVAVLALDVRHDPRFTANGIPASTGRITAGPTEFAVFVPGGYVLAHDTEYLRADPAAVLAADVGATVDASVEVEPRPAFGPALAEAVAAHLEACAEQEVLFPTGCPFGETITNRIVSAPEWSIEHLPRFDVDGDVEPGDFGVWIAGPAPGTAHLVVEVQSLFDGKLSTFDQDVPFQARYLVTVGDTLRVAADAAD